MENVHESVVKQFREQQQKFAYYVVALCTAGIGFSVQQTVGIPLKQTQIPLAIAVFLWGISIYCGLRFIKLMISALYANLELITMMQGTHSLTGNNPNSIKIGVESIEESLEKKSQKTMFLGKWQTRLFYWGIAFFVGWRIWEMYSITPPAVH